MEKSMSVDCFAQIQSFIHQLTGITISSERINMVEGRVSKRVKALALKTFDEYLRFVRSDETEKAKFVDLITTNETYFFRTPRIWNYLEEHFLPKWHAQNRGKKLAAWSAAASSGEEANSLGILFQAFKNEHPDFRYQITGTDISQEMISRCENGTYFGRSIRTFRDRKPEWFAQFMTPVSTESDAFTTIPEIRSQLRFSQHNLFQTYRKSTDFDLVLARNVLIYFTPTDQEKVLANLNQKLKSDGLLIIGESESLSHIKSPFEKVEPYIYRPVQLATTTKAAR